MILTPRTANPEVMQIDTWVMSCRVFGRELEYEAMNIAVETAAANGFRALRGDYVPTAKNAVIKNLYPDLGFRPVDSSSPAHEASSWELDLGQYQPRRTHIHRDSQPS